jgi:synaptosomal-associated protein 29
MAGKYINSKDLFLDDDDADDFNTTQKQLHELNQKKSAIENNMISSTQRTLRCLDETEQIGIGTSMILATQREQLEEVDNKLDKIDIVLSNTQVHLNGMKSMFGGIKKYFSKSNLIPENNTSTIDKAQTKTSIKHSNNVIVPSTTVQHKGNENEYQNEEFEQELEKNLQQMSNYLGRLQNMGQHMGEELDYQNTLIDGIKYKVDQSDLKITKQRKDMNKL